MPLNSPSTALERWEESDDAFPKFLPRYYRDNGRRLKPFEVPDVNGLVSPPWYAVDVEKLACNCLGVLGPVPPPPPPPPFDHHHNHPGAGPTATNRPKPPVTREATQPYAIHRTHSCPIPRMDERDAVAAPPSVQPAADPTQTNVEAQIASREQVTGAMSGLAPGLGSGPSAEEPPPSAQPPTAARAQAQASNPATRSITTAPVPGRAPATATAPRSAPAPAAAPSHGHGHGHEQPALRVPRFVAPSSYLRFKTSHGSAMAAAASEPTSNPSTLSPPSPLDKEQRQGLVWTIRFVPPSRQFLSWA